MTTYDTRRPLLALRRTVSIGVALTLLVLGVPHLSSTPWAAVATTVGAVPVLALVALAALWLSGLVAHTFTLTAALPRLTHVRALTLSLTGSAVANVLPFGGAAGVALNYRMTRAWGFDASAFTAYTVVTNAWNVLLRLSLPAVAVAWLLVTGGLAGVASAGLLRVAGVATGGLGVLAVLGGVVMTSDRATSAVGRALDRGISLLPTRSGTRRTPSLAVGLLRVRADVASVVRRGWRRLTTGMVAYAVLTATLLWSCLHLTHAGLALPAVFAGFALERALGLVGLTPGGAGVVEVGLTGLLLALGGDPVGTVAGVLLYRSFTFALEIPVGGLGLVGWLWADRRRSTRAAEAACASVAAGAAA